MKIKYHPIFKGLNKNIIVLSIVSFFTDISSEMLYPIIPIFLVSVLGAPMSILGLIEGIAESAASVLKAFSGWFSDKSRHRKNFVTGGYFLSSLGKLFFFLAYAWPMVLAARLIDRIGKGIRTSPRDAMIADSCEARYRGKAFGFHRAADTLGAILGPLLALWLIVALKENIRIVFLIAFIPAMIAVGLLVFFLKEAPRLSQVNGGALRLNIRQFSPAFGKFLLVSVIFSIGNSSDAFLIMRAKGIGLSMAAVILAYVVYNISYSALSFPAGIISDRIPRKVVMIGGYLIFAFVYLGFANFANKSSIWLLFFIYGFYMAMTDGVSKAFVTDTVNEEVRGTAIGLYYCLTGLCAFFASLIAGLLWTYAGASAPFIYGAVMAALSCLGFLILIK
jgi:MFS family permease